MVFGHHFISFPSYLSLYQSHNTVFLVNLSYTLGFPSLRCSRVTTIYISISSYRFILCCLLFIVLMSFSSFTFIFLVLHVSVLLFILSLLSYSRYYLLLLTVHFFFIISSIDLSGSFFICYFDTITLTFPVLLYCRLLLSLLIVVVVVL